MNDNNGLAALGLLFLLGVALGALLVNTGQGVDFSLVASKQGVAFGVSTHPALN